MTQSSPQVAYVAVGSNIDPLTNITKALSKLLRLDNVTATSTFYKNAPLNRPEQPFFANGVWRLKTNRSVKSLKYDILRNIEKDLNRVRTSDRHAPRTIDLDILLYGNFVIHDPHLQIPDPSIRTRPFVAHPLLELDPDLVIPGWNEHLSSLEAANDNRGLEPLNSFSQQLRKGIEQ